MNKFLALVLVLISFQLLGQESELKIQLQKTTQDSIRFRILGDLPRSLGLVDKDRQNCILCPQS